MMPAKAIREHPFCALVAHFARRLFASEEEQAVGGLGLGLGAVLALVASPGAFASIFLMGKYSTLIQWMRGQRIDAIRRSPSDEYFFIVLSMTIVGLLMVARWNRLFPDRRDFANLAILPIPIRNIFLSNLAVLFGLSILFGVVVNFVSSILFPFFVTISIGTLTSFLHVAVAHAMSVFLASLFSFFAVLSLVGLLSLVVPRVLFRPVSLLVRIILVVGLLTEFFSNILLQLFAGKLPGSGIEYMRYVPSFWFVALYERLLGIGSSAIQQVGSLALMAVGAVIALSTLCYALCYRRIFLRLPESLEMVTNSRSFIRIRLPVILLRVFYRSAFERACLGFVRRVLVRSEAHLMFLGAYMGIGVVIALQTTLGTASAQDTSPVPGAGYIALPLLMALFIASGLRFAFDMSAAREANWIFKTVSNSTQPSAERMARRILFFATVPWQLLIFLPLAVGRMGFLRAFLHIGLVAAITILFVCIVTARFPKIPFTYLMRVDIRPLIIKMLLTVFGVMAFVPALAEWERWMLVQPLRVIPFAFLLLAAFYWLMRYQNVLSLDEPDLVFEDGPAADFQLLKLT